MSTHYRAKKSAEVYATWKCPQCGHRNVRKQEIVAKGYNSSYLPSEKVAQDTRAQTSFLLQYNFMMLLSDKKELTKEKFLVAKMNCTCEKCRRREPWAKMRYGIIDSLMVFVGMVLWITGIFAVLISMGGNLRPLLIPAAIGAVEYGLKMIKDHHINKMVQEIEKLPPEAVAQFALDKEGLKALGLEYDVRKGIWQDKIVPDAEEAAAQQECLSEGQETEHKEVRFCKTCGSKVGSEAVFCGNCGTQLR